MAAKTPEIPALAQPALKTADTGAVRNFIDHGYHVFENGVDPKAAAAVPASLNLPVTPFVLAQQNMVMMERRAFWRPPSRTYFSPTPLKSSMRMLTAIRMTARPSRAMNAVATRNAEDVMRLGHLLSPGCWYFP